MWNVVKKEFIQFWRYKTLLIFTLLLPVIQLQGVARSSATPTMELPMAVYDQDHSASSRELVQMLDASDVFAADYTVFSAAELARLLENGTAKAGLTIPPDFGSRFSRGDLSTVQMVMDASEPSATAQASSHLERAAPLYAQGLSDAGSADLSFVVNGRVEPRSRVWFNEEMREELFRLPGAMASSVAMLAIFLTASVIVRERETGTLEQLFVTPIRPVELIVSKGLLTMVVTYVAFLEMLALCIFHFGVPLRGSLALLLGLTAFYAFVEIGFGLIISVIAHTQGQALLTAFFWSLLERILSGQILPVENMPQAAQVAAQFAPLTHFTAIVRGIMLKGSTLPDLAPQLFALIGLAVALYAVAARGLNKRLD
jgi:ABC-2 type transport system permease protein